MSTGMTSLIDLVDEEDPRAACEAPLRSGPMLLATNEEIREFASEAFLYDGEARETVRFSLEKGADLLGEAFMRANSQCDRRTSGSVFSPFPLVRRMVNEAVARIDPDLIVDCGCGSGRFAVAAAQAFPGAAVLAIDDSDIACKMCEANAIAAGLGDRIVVDRADFVGYDVPRGKGSVLWIGNPPYVRHHDISREHKRWLKRVGAQLDQNASGLSGLHVYFLANIARQWREGDFGVLVTSAEWMDVGYGSFVRRLLVERLRLTSLEIPDKRERCFEGTDTTSVVFSFGGNCEADRVSVRRCGETLDVSRSELADAMRWSDVFDHSKGAVSDGLVPLGEIARVHRGIVTGDNSFWVRSPSESDGLPASIVVPIISHAREIMGDCVAQAAPESLNRIIALPADLGSLEEGDARVARALIEEARREGVDRGYVASHRKPWWSIKIPDPPAILMTYMGRGRPVFVVNERRLPMLNVVHGIYPKAALSHHATARLAQWLNDTVDLGMGRMYCGGLVKFEPREAESIMIPTVEKLESDDEL